MIDPPSAERFPRHLRLVRRADFKRVFAENQRVVDDTLTMFGALQDLEYPRLGLVVSRKVGNAVLRNRWKRLIREAFRRQQHVFPAGLDIVVLPRREACCSSVAVGRSLPKLVHRLARRLGGKVP